MIRNTLSRFKKWVGGKAKGKPGSSKSRGWEEDSRHMNAEAQALSRKQPVRRNNFYSSSEWRRRKRRMQMVRDSRRANRG